MIMLSLNAQLRTFVSNAHSLSYGLTVLIAVVLLSLFIIYNYHETKTSIESSSSNKARILADKWEIALRRLEATASYLHDLATPENAKEPLVYEAILDDGARLTRLAEKFPDRLGFVCH